MAKTLDEMLAKRPVDPAVLTEHRNRMLSEVRAYRLRQLREQLNLTQTDVAALLSVSQKRVSRIERGDIEHAQVDTLRRYAEALGGTLRVEIAIGDEAYQVA